MEEFAQGYRLMGSDGHPHQATRGDHELRGGEKPPSYSGGGAAGGAASEGTGRARDHEPPRRGSQQRPSPVEGAVPSAWFRSSSGQEFEFAGVGRMGRQQRGGARHEGEGGGGREAHPQEGFSRASWPHRRSQDDAGSVIPASGEERSIRARDGQALSCPLSKGRCGIVGGSSSSAPGWWSPISRFLLIVLLFCLGTHAEDSCLDANSVRVAGVCLCKAGYFMNVNDICAPLSTCRAGKYCPDNGMERVCPAGMDSPEGSTSMGQCGCNEEGYFNLNGNCKNSKTECPRYYDCYTSAAPVRHALAIRIPPGTRLTTRYAEDYYYSGGVAGVAFDRQPSVQTIGNWSAQGTYYSFASVILVNNPGCGDLMGNLTAPLINGVANFTDLMLGASAKGVILRFCAGDCFLGERPVREAESSYFNIRPGRLLVVTQPGQVISGEAFGVQPVIKAQVQRSPPKKPPKEAPPFLVSRNVKAPVQPSSSSLRPAHRPLQLDCSMLYAILFFHHPGQPYYQLILKCIL